MSEPKASATSPCYNNGLGCKDRHPGCHTLCPRYKIWRAELNRRTRRNPGDLDIKAYTVAMVERQNKKAHKRNAR